MIPSCYACNSKFKKEDVFTKIDYYKDLSPSSKDFSVNENVSFKIYYKNEQKNINSSNDFNLLLEINDKNVMMQEYLNMFKLEGRYTFHKNLLPYLIKKKINYPNSKIEEISIATGYSKDKIRKDIFGDELFEDHLSNQPLVKMKRDVFKNNLLKDVI